MWDWTRSNNLPNHNLNKWLLITKNISICAEAISKRCPFLWYFCRWFHGELPRETSEKLLEAHEEGTFLIRSSHHFKGDYTLSVRDPEPKKIEHYRIRSNNGRPPFTIDEETFFNDLDSIVRVTEKQKLFKSIVFNLWQASVTESWYTSPARIQRYWHRDQTFRILIKILK